MMRRKNDILWKGILEDVFDDFLLFLNPDARLILDFNRGFVFLDKEMEQIFPPENDEYAPKVIDKLVKAFTKTGKEEWILCHVEIQGQYQKDFASRMFNYFIRIYDKYQRPVTAYAIFTEPNTKVRPDLFAIDFMGTSLRYTFNTYKIASQNEEALRASDNPFAMVILTAKAAFAGKEIKNSEERDLLLLEVKLNLAKLLLAKQIAKEKIRMLMNFLKYYVRFENQDINAKFEKEVEILTGRSNTMGIEELLIDRAKHEEAVNIARAMKKDGISLEQIAKFTKLSIQEIEKL